MKRFLPRLAALGVLLLIAFVALLLSSASVQHPSKRCLGIPKAERIPAAPFPDEGLIGGRDVVTAG
jgi:hypothetical protein